MCYILCRIIHVLLVYSTKLGRSLASRERCLNEKIFFQGNGCISALFPSHPGPRQKFPLSWTTLHLGSTMEIILTQVSSLIPCFHALSAGNSDTSAVFKTSIKTEWKWFLLAWNPCAILATTTNCPWSIFQDGLAQAYAKGFCWDGLWRCVNQADS